MTAMLKSVPLQQASSGSALSRTYSNLVDADKIRRFALCGHVQTALPNFNRIVRLFISSTFKDMIDERDKIMHEIYPKLEDYCSKKGYILQIVDMRWGIFESTANNQLITDICLDEIRLAREISNGPFFIAILSHRYGSKFAPRTIPKDEFDLLLKDCTAEEQELLHNWYEIDENNIPAIYQLKSLTGSIMKSQWETNDQTKIVKILGRRAELSDLDEERTLNYTRSVTEIEIHEGLFKTVDCNDRCLTFMRDINVLHRFTTGRIPDDLFDVVNKYIDTDENRSTVDRTAHFRLSDLRKRISQKLRRRNIKTFSIQLDSASNLLDSTLMNDTMDNYLEDFLKSFQSKVTNLIETNLNKNEFLFHTLEKYSDLFHHIRFCQQKLKGFMGRHQLIDRIRRALIEQQIQCIIIHGISGSGKTSLVAKIAHHLIDWFPNIDITVVLRFIGTSEDSYNIQNLLSSIIRQLAHRFDLMILEEEMNPINRLYAYFKKFLCEVSEECSAGHQIFILLDSLDQLSTDYNGRRLDWFPVSIPSNIRFIVSTLEEIQYETFAAIQRVSSNLSNEFIEVTELEEIEIQSAINDRLQKSNRTVTAEQMEYLLENFRQCSIPLYMKLVMDQAIKWKHADSKTDIRISRDIKSIIENFLENLEESHGSVFVRKALQYMTLSRHGFYENYLQNILGNDNDVLNDIKENFPGHQFRAGRIPQIFFIRLRNALNEYLTGPMCRWYHRAFWEVASERYCQDTKSNENCHRNIVTSYLHQRFNRGNSFWINELPYHCTLANNLDKLKENFLFNLKFLQTKVVVCDIDELIKDYEFAMRTYPNDQGIELVHQVLLIAAFKIRQDPLQLPGQLFSRLQGFAREGNMASLLRGCLSPPEYAIISDFQFMAGPNPRLIKSFVAHRAEIKSTVVSNDGRKIVSCSIDNCIKIFDAKTFVEQLTFYKKYSYTNSLTISNDDSLLYTWCRTMEDKNTDLFLIEAFDMNTGNHKYDVARDMMHDPITKHRQLMFAHTKDELWLITKDKWYHLDWQTGTIRRTDHLPPVITNKPDKPLCLDQSKDRLAIGLEEETIVGSLSENGSYMLLDLHDKTVMGRRMLILNDSTLLISVRRIFKSLYDERDMEWFILFCHLETLEIQRQIPLNKSLRMWKSSLDSKKIYCNAFNNIYVLDIENYQTDFILEHSSQMNSCDLLSESMIVSSTWDNKLNVWDIGDRKIITHRSFSDHNRINLFDESNSRMIRFLYDEFNTQSRYVFIYNVRSKNSKELFLVYDLLLKKPVRKCHINKYSSHDLLPLGFVNQEYVGIYCVSRRSFYFLNINFFTLLKEFPSDQSRCFKKISSQYVVMSIHDRITNTDKLVLLDCNLLCFETIISDWIDIEWFDINTKTIVFKKKTMKTARVFSIDQRTCSDLFVDNNQGEILQVLSSRHGQYVAVIRRVDPSEKSIEIYQIDDKSTTTSVFKKDRFKQLDQLKFLDDRYFVYQFKDNTNRLTYCYDLFNKIAHQWFKDDDRLGSFDCLKHPLSNYIWYQRYQVNRQNRVQTDISIYHVQDVEKPICCLDVDCRLRINQAVLLDNGNVFLAKCLDSLDFVMFFLKSRSNMSEDMSIPFNDFYLSEINTELRLERNSFDLCSRLFSFVNYTRESDLTLC